MVKNVGALALTGLFVLMAFGCMGDPADDGDNDVTRQASVSRPAPGTPRPELPPSPEDQRRQAEQKRREEKEQECRALFECLRTPSCWNQLPTWVQQSFGWTMLNECSNL
jgi:hypothetical protein